MRSLSERTRYVSKKTAASGKMAASDGKDGDGLVEVVGGTRVRDDERDGARREREQEQGRRVVMVRSEGEVVGEQRQVVDGMRRMVGGEARVVSGAGQMVGSRR